ncbi:MAG: ATP-binding protein [Actinomycetaceae bacterium]|nr:ATP-binding protein [Actinomycetaceae bacterium]
MSSSLIDNNEYKPRIVDKKVQEYLDIFGAVEIAGTKWCGKTWTALRHGKSVSYVDTQIDLIKADKNIALMGEAPHVIDEWQFVPEIWNAVRHNVDTTAQKRGAYILTGSSTPDVSSDTPMHSGAGRIGKIRMYPMSCYETNDSHGKVSLEGLFNGEFTSCEVNTSAMGLVDIACRGGWPEATHLSAHEAQTIAAQYVSAISNNSIAQLGLKPDVAQRLMLSLARNIGQSATYKTLLRDMYGAEEGKEEEFLSQTTLAHYIASLKRMYVIEEIPGWVPQARSPKRFQTKPKRYFSDPSLPVALLGMGPEALLNDWQTFGFIFENMCVRDLSVYINKLPVLGTSPVRYYNDDSGLEIDAIIELADGSWAAFEMKTGMDKVPSAITNLKRLRKKLANNPRQRNPEPAFMAVLVGVGEYAYQAEDGIYVIPLQALGA